MEEDKKTDLILSLKRNVLQLPQGTVAVDFDKEAIYKIIPHRPPFDLVTSITAIHLGEAMVEVTSVVDPADPIFEGHFPGMPVYPGVFLIETMGQAGLCLAFFVKNQVLEIKDDSTPVKGLFTRVHNAGFNKGIKPGDHLLVRAQMIEDDDYMGLICAQIIMDNQVYAHSILEVYYP